MKTNSPIKTPKELTKAKKVAKKRVAKKPLKNIGDFTEYNLNDPVFKNGYIGEVDDIVFKFDQREIKTKTNYLKDGLIVIATVAIIFTVGWLATLEAGTLKTCYETWKSI